jgi:N-acetylglucosamine-6-phosphate deacetylase
MRTLLTNARIISPGVDRSGCAITIDDGRITSVAADVPPGVADATFDCAGAMVLPGFIDIHTHGVAGSDVSDGRAGSVQRIAEARLREGVTTFFPTTLTLPFESLAHAAREVATYRLVQRFAKTPALHIEGPFINPRCVGAQNPAYVRPPDSDEIFRLKEIAPVGIVSMAVEMPGGFDFLSSMTAAGITTSLAHTAATFAQFSEARSLGLRHVTHFGNQMTPLHHREIGIVGAALADSDVMIEIICDTVHVCPDMISLFFSIKPIRQIMLITDSMAAAGLGDGDFELGGLRVLVRNGEARLESGNLAGSTLAFNHALRNVHRITGLPLAQLVESTSWNQARSLGLPGLGKIEPGFIADLAVLDDSFEVKATFVDGVRRFAA